MADLIGRQYVPPKLPILNISRGVKLGLNSDNLENILHPLSFLVSFLFYSLAYIILQYYLLS